MHTLQMSPKLGRSAQFSADLFNPPNLGALIYLAVMQCWTGISCQQPRCPMPEQSRRPHRNRSRHDVEPQPGDEQDGTWPREQLEQMDRAFRAALVRELGRPC
jgi:hypothetical protein